MKTYTICWTETRNCYRDIKAESAADAIKIAESNPLEYDQASNRYFEEFVAVDETDED